MAHQLPLSHKSQINVSKSSKSSLFGLKIEKETEICHKSPLLLQKVC